MKLPPDVRRVKDALKGKTIAACDMRPFSTGRLGDPDPATNPRIRFTDGTELTFVVEETEEDAGGDYGVHLCLVGAPKRVTPDHIDRLVERVAGNNRTGLDADGRDALERLERLARLAKL